MEYVDTYTIYWWYGISKTNRSPQIHLQDREHFERSRIAWGFEFPKFRIPN